MNNILPQTKTLASLVQKKQEPKEEVETADTVPKNDKFLFITSFGEILDLAIHLKVVEKKEVLMHIADHNYSKIGDGIIEKCDNWHEYLGQGFIFVCDGCEGAKLQDWLRDQGEYVVGTNEVMADYENDRQKGQKLFKSAGYPQPMSKNFTNIDEALSFVRDNKDTRYILKQNGDAPKHLNHMGKFDGNEDMIFHLEDLKKSWNEMEFGKVDFDLMEVVEGIEVAASAFFNGEDWLRDEDGKIVGFLNFEHKKETDGDMGETTGETGTLFFGTDEDNELFADILLRPEIENVLRETEYHGVFDINGSVTDKGFVAFEPTSRFGIPASSYEFIEGLKTPFSALLSALARGINEPVEIKKGWGMVMVIMGKPFPVEADIDDEATSAGEKLWILQDGKPVKDFSKDQWKHIHLENFSKTDEGDYKVATKNGYLLTVTGSGDSIEEVRDNLKDYIKDNIYISGMKFRQDIGKKIEEKTEELGL